MGNVYADRIETLKDDSHKIELNISKTKLKIKANYLLSVRDQASVGEAFATIVHELGHFFCHHLPSIPNNAWKQRFLDHITKEFEAEAVSYIVCSRYGVNSPSVEYLNTYYSKNKTIPHISPENIFTACNQIINMINGITYKQCILYKYDKEFKAIVEKIKRDSR